MTARRPRAEKHLDARNGDSASSGSSRARRSRLPILVLGLLVGLQCRGSFAKDVELVIDSIPSGATLEINGSLVGKTPYKELRPKAHFGLARAVMAKYLRSPLVVRVRMDGYSTREIELTQGPQELRNPFDGTYLGNIYVLQRSYVIQLDPVPVLTADPQESSPVQAKGAEESILALADVIPVEIQAAAGLDRLGPAEKAVLEEWAREYSANCKATEGYPQAATERARPATPRVIESHIEGDFEGWEGETIFVLDNGQIWQQVEYSYMYHYAYHPKVIIVFTSAGWTMTVDGVSETIRVEQLR